MKDVKFLEHKADVKFQARGETLEKAFEKSALAMFYSMYEKSVASDLNRHIEVGGKDLESLLYNFLEELLFLLDAENFFVSEIKVKINQEKFKLEADVFGDDAGKYPIGLDVKAVTYNQMFVKREEGKWICQVVLDV